MNSLSPNTPRLIGILTSAGSLTGEIFIKKQNLTFQGQLTIPEKIKGEEYDGVYNIRPSIEEQELETKNKTMRSNLKVEKIPYYEVSNFSDGQTVIIGE